MNTNAENHTMISNIVTVGASTKNGLLPFDIWSMVIDQLWGKAREYKEDSKGGETMWVQDPLFQTWLRELRTVSKYFNKKITTLVYEKVVFTNDKLVRYDPMSLQEKFKADTIQYAKHSSFAPHLEESYMTEVIDVISKGKHVVEVQWNIGIQHTDVSLMCIQASLHAFLKRTVRCEVRSRRFSLVPGGQDYDNHQVRFIATDLSGKLMKRKTLYQDSRKLEDPPQLGLDSSVFDPLAIAPVLKLHIWCVWMMPIFITSHACPIFRQLPAVSKLNLKNYHWDHTAENYGQIWDFSDLQDLCLHGIVLTKFFLTVSLEALAKLRRLRLTAANYPTLFGNNLNDLQAAIRKLLGEYKQLEKLKLRVKRWQEIFPPLLICEFGQSLVYLSLRGWSYAGVHLSLQELRRIRTACTNLHTLGVDLPKLKDTHEHFLQNIGRFDTATTIYLYVVGGFEANGVEAGSTDPDYDQAMVLLPYLKSCKYGNSLQCWQVEAEGCWQVQRDGQYLEKRGYWLGERCFTCNVNLKGDTYTTGSKRIDEFIDHEEHPSDDDSDDEVPGEGQDDEDLSDDGTDLEATDIVEGGAAGVETTAELGGN
ncbi:uncharacterized protein LY89DRAFT_780730 [Mollisia scopiformis]|uniref:Uncharacterized protein n=1 Tax=Mollisia scopiformis TaxID=149040 RepID=A0A194XEU2_MOLSC|nr:uncharacterized protein LY89DRAFT_780730 [Mollisia scopiformis]KUJ18710.1 hypothetical protein LY89DRAFT_780730 [Mollisia scopiformis]